MSTIKKALEFIGLVGVVATALANLLPKSWVVTLWCARVGAALKGWKVVPHVEPAAVPATPPPPVPSSEAPTNPAAGLYPPAVLPVLALALAIATSGCAMTLRSGTVAAGPVGGDPTCDAIDREHSIATALTGGLGTLAGAGGLTAIPVDKPEVRAGLVTGASASGLAAAVMGLWAQERAERYNKRCAP